MCPLKTWIKHSCAIVVWAVFSVTSLCSRHTWSLTSVTTEGPPSSSWKRHWIHARWFFLCVNKMVDWGIMFSKNPLYSWCRKKGMSFNTHVQKKKGGGRIFLFYNFFLVLHWHFKGVVHVFQEYFSKQHWVNWSHGMSSLKHVCGDMS